MSDKEEVAVPEHEHEHKVTIHEDIYIEDHEARKETSIFSHAKKELKSTGYHACSICGDEETVEYHHLLERCFINAINWQWVKDFMLGKTDVFFSHKLKKIVPIPKLHPIHLIKHLSQGFDWENFDVNNPVTFVDSKYNQLPLCSHHHRGSDHGVHELTLSSWSVQGFLKEDFIFSPDEIKE